MKIGKKWCTDFDGSYSIFMRELDEDSYGYGANTIRLTVTGKIPLRFGKGSNKIYSDTFDLSYYDLQDANHNPDCITRKIKYAMREINDKILQDVLKGKI